METQGNPSQPKSDWKDSPLYVATVVAVGTASVVTAVFTQVVIPTKEQDLSNQLKQLQLANTDLTNKASALVASAKVAEVERKKVQSDLDATKNKLKETALNNLFSVGNPYPSGLRAVRVGESVTNVSRLFGQALIKKEEDGAITIKDPSGVFHEVSYYFSSDDPRRKITHIAFALDENNYAPDFLQAKLQEALGAPSIGKKPNHSAWLTSNDWGAFKSEPFTYVVMIKGANPQWWRLH